MPHNHKKKLAKFYYADKDLVNKAIQTACEAQQKWDRVPIPERLRIWETAASLMAKEYRAKLNAATMLGQAKTIIQAEIDSAAELVDFFRLNAYFLKEASKYQPISEDPKVTKNSMRYRGIDGFIAAVSPFNFTAIGGNLAYTPALMSLAVRWMNEPLERDVLQVSKVAMKGCEASTRRVNLAGTAKGETIFRREREIEPDRQLFYGGPEKIQQFQGFFGCCTPNMGTVFQDRSDLCLIDHKQLTGSEIAPGPKQKSKFLGCTFGN
ncbi:unnamed protein product [Phaedon cochleariae]|uniref:Aldehyde dehydrogenase domain-containing protein n=1 Tax=Phaedon cochleariae TaxID=80249 RepID=A0A9N9SES8_PHACE|nr:unnamed protein product [Phaedon cochleariae]